MATTRTERGSMSDKTAIERTPPSSSLPPAFGVGPPHCLKKNATPSRRHSSRTSLAQSADMRRAPGPDSPRRSPRRSPGVGRPAGRGQRQEAHTIGPGQPPDSPADASPGPWLSGPRPTHHTRYGADTPCRRTSTTDNPSWWSCAWSRPGRCDARPPP